jgi:hypothetical protein
MTDDIRPGDVVQPKSRGPDRRVARIDDQDSALSARCSGLDGNKQQAYRLATTLPTNSDGTRKP